MNSQQKASLAFERKKYKKAADLYQLLMKQEPDNAQYHENLADCYYQLGRLEVAFAETGIALEKNPDLARSHSIRGSIYFRQKRYEDCEREEKKAIELDPARNEPYRVLAGIATANKDQIESIRILREALQFNPEDWKLHWHLGWVYMRTKQYKDATHETQLVYQSHPSFSTLLESLMLYESIYRQWMLLALGVILFLGPLLFRLIYFLPILIIFVVYFVTLGVYQLRNGYKPAGRLRFFALILTIIGYFLIFLSIPSPINLKKQAI